jgi:hypothetical protein
MTILIKLLIKLLVADGIELRTVQPVASRYTVCATPTPLVNLAVLQKAHIHSPSLELSADERHIVKPSEHKMLYQFFRDMKTQDWVICLQRFDTIKWSLPLG